MCDRLLAAMGTPDPSEVIAAESDIKARFASRVAGMPPSMSDLPEYLRGSLVAIKTVKSHLAISFCDKSVNTFSFNCKYMMAIMVLEEHLRPGSSYVMCSISPRIDVHRTESDVIAAAIAFTRSVDMIPVKRGADGGWEENISESLGYVNVAPKLHKPVDKFKFRYLVSSPDTVFTPVSTWCAIAWGAVRQDVLWLWSQLQAEHGIRNGELAPPWLILTADSVSGCVERLNLVSSCDTQLHCFDVEQYYTNVPHQDLLKQLRFVIDLVAQKRREQLPMNQQGHVAGAGLYLVVHTKHLKIPYEWVYLRDSEVARKSSSTCKVLSVDMCMKLAEFIVVNAYFMLGDQLFLQILGIPMGANPSPAFT